MSIYTSNNRFKQVIETTKGSTIGMGGITLLIVVAMLFFAILPAINSITDQVKNNEAKTKYLTELKKKKTILDKLSVTYKDNLTQIDYFNLYNNSVVNTETFVANIDAIAKKNNGVLKNINFSESNASGDDYSPFADFSAIKPVGLNMQFDIKMSYVSSLINSLEEFPLTIFMDSLSLTQAKNATNNVVKGPISLNDYLTLSISGEIYFWN